MKNIILLIIFKTFFFTAFSQKITDAFYLDFRKSVIDYLANIQKNRMDTLIVIFDCKAVAFEKSFHSGGANFTIRKDSCRNVGFDTSKLKAKNVLVTSTSTFDFYLNFLLASENSEKPGPGNVKGSYAYVYMTVEEWQQFYLDYLLGYKTIYLSPVIDIFRFNE
ncbi:MAG: hypothetical protein EAZ16_11125, partial [Sphingobacteriales bacterium]